MRYDDMIATVLAQPADRADRLAARWRQLVDLLAQRRGQGDPALAAEALAFLASHRSEIPVLARREAAASLVGLPADPDLVAFFAQDRAEIMSPLMAGARLEAEEWIAILPRLQPTARGLLRHRRDLPPSVVRALGAFGSVDLVLEGAAAEPPPPAAGEKVRAEAGRGETESQIRALVDRIEAYRRRRPERPAEASAQDKGEPAQAFRWETGSDGVLSWIEGAPREALIGQSLAVIAGPSKHGVDGQAAGAFGRRSPFRDARFSVAGTGPASGDWRISGVPVFDPKRGSFLGYRGVARRPRLDEIAHAPAAETKAGLFGTDLPPDALRQLVHELRTPLNAIIGFAEMIEGQYLGPAARPYRGRAAEIVDQARRLLGAVDDLDTAARLETRRLDLDPERLDAAGLMERLYTAFQRVAEQRGAELRLDVAPDLPLSRVDTAAAERMFGRLLAATIGLAAPGETIRLALTPASLSGRPTVSLSLDRPQAIRGLEERALLDPGYSPEGDWPDAPALGLGFALRLVRNLAEAAGGALMVGETLITLHLPAVEAADRPAGTGEGGA